MRPRYWLFALVVVASGAVAVMAQLKSPPQSETTLPSPRYLDHPPQYFPPSPPFPLPREQAALEAQARAPLPVAQAVLFSSGVGYFQREGVVDGTARVDLTFPMRDVNDLLKSMIVRDLDGGHVGAVSYDSNAPVEKTLNSFAINLTGNPSLAAILNQARGEKVEAVMQPTGTYTGTVVGVEKQHLPAGKDAFVDVDLLNLSCSDGLRSLKMSDVQRVRFLNPVMDSELRKALETLATSHDTQKKAVSINFVGEGKRKVRVGYVVENPIWKTSYRLVLSPEKDAKPYLQGWAVVENVSDEDWKDVRVALVSGRPISFQMDLYQPLFVPRPTVEPELFASLRPQVYNGDLQNMRDYEGLTGRNAEIVKPLPSGGVAGIAFSNAYQITNLPSRQSNNWSAQMRLNVPSPVLNTGQPLLQGFGYDINGLGGRLDNSVSPVATAAKLGDFFQYVIDQPVTLPRQKSAMLPIIGKEVAATRVSIYNEATLAQHPLLGVRLKNTSGLHLMQGPITVFDNGTYAGDARILDLVPNEERLVSYAIDLGTEVEAKPDRGSGRVTLLKLSKGILESRVKLREGKTYRIKNRAEEERVVLVEHPVRSEFQLVSKDKPTERTRDVYRFAIKVPAGQSAALEVVEERSVAETAQLTNADDEAIRVLISSPASNAKLKDALKKALELRTAQATTQRELAEIEVRLRGITEDQARLRANLKEMPATTAAYKRYLDKFDQQETEIEKLQAQSKTLQTKTAEQRQAFEMYLMGLDVESPVEGNVPAEEPPAVGRVSTPGAMVP